MPLDAPVEAAAREEWRAIPGVPTPSSRVHHAGLVVAAVVCGPLIGVVVSGPSLPGLVAATAVLLAAAYVVWTTRSAPARVPAFVAAAAVSGAVVGAVAGAGAGVWAAVAILLAGVLVGTAATARVLEAVGRWVGTAVRVVLFAPLATLLVVFPWVADRILRNDPLRGPERPGSAWLPRRRTDVHPDQLWADDAVSARPTPGRRVRWALRVPVTVALLAILGLLVSVAVDVLVPASDEAPSGVADVEIPAAYRDAPWYPEYLRDISWVESPYTAWQPLQPHRIGDVNTKWVNVSDGVRAGWHPPECQCRRLKVWFYGGSTAFGLGQRDEHTIASELARVAWDNGIALDVDNRGVVGDVHWQEADRYAWDVATYGPPDLVVFYDGINDTTATQTLVNARVGDRYAPVDFQNDDQWRRFLQVETGTPPETLEGASVPTSTTVPGYDDDGFASLLMARYDRSRKISAMVSEAGSTPTYYTWQPTRFSRPTVPGEVRAQRGTGNARAREAAILRRLPADVIDLTDSLSSNRDPLFYDDQHHNEVGARLVADALFDRLAPDLAKLAAGEAVSTPLPLGSAAG